MIIQLLFHIILLWLNRTSAVAASLAQPGCPETCGDVTIPYPFGIGANCSANETFTITCNNSFSPPKPFIISVTNILEVLEISLEGTARVNNPVITSNCSNRADDLWVYLFGPFTFSDTYNRFIAMGCDNLAMATWNGVVIGGCMSICNVTSEENSCYGISCCQTTIPSLLNFFQVNFSSIDTNNDQKTCKYAFMVDHEWFNNLTNPYVVRDMQNVPVVLNWRTDGMCESFGTSSSMPLCGPNASCLSLNQSSRYLCYCDDGYEGNPYLRDGCQGRVLK
uniref:Putative wall-associated receptor kinase-like 1 n=1 Tax=Davidia involucrata TaxID=16924 RepID=A0A5B7BWE9_DAVIN